MMKGHEMTDHLCGWLVERPLDTTPPADYPDEHLDGWYEQMGDIAAETGGYQIEECGAEVTELEDGWQCAAGHHHYTYGSARQQAEERQEAWEELNGYDRYAI